MRRRREGRRKVMTDLSPFTFPHQGIAMRPPENDSIYTRKRALSIN